DSAILTSSYYGKKFHGRRTSNGEIFNMYGYSAAHKTLPFGTVLKVTYLKNGKSVLVTVNDRGPFIKGRELDLSYMAAKKIGLTREGVGKVKIRVVKWGQTGE
ncbi:MAG: septal ring lytic transglycosylase RlpA family protein, partial [Candidatus Marinimicrobia bacterium]|nr:septal ring lytic transglycosylase RlpA family protein [Candidatus Neomarinimicrobiota bacterium]